MGEIRKMAERELFLWNDGWQFLKQPLGSGFDEILEKRSEFCPVNIPHDWLIYNTDNLYENGVGWYRKSFTYTKSEAACSELYFEGVYMDSSVYLNGRLIGEWKYGYSSFFFDITEALEEGENELFVRVCYQSPNSRWYSGAGIYRNVYFIRHSSTHFVTDSLYITPAQKGNDWTVKAEAELVLGKSQTQQELQLKAELYNEEKELVLTQCRELKDSIIGEGEAGSITVRIMTNVSEPSLWSMEQPNLYLCKISLLSDNGICDTVSEKIGFRSITFDTEKGLFLNGKHVKLNGACEHHDFGAIGAVFNKSAMRRKLEILKQMGVNSIRSTHNMPAIGLLELCDEMGLLVVNEAFDMWERSKTEYDYARFFPEWWRKDIRSWVRRDRNHASLLFWSIGNEIYDTHADKRGQEVTKLLAEETRRYDPDCHAQITIGSNFMPWENARACADIVKFAGYNYGEKYYDEHHKEHPDWYIYGSETASTVQSRGIYHFPYKQSVLADEDEQCSALGNSTTSWGAKSSEACIITERDHEFSLGQFLWSGFDYIGEPTPYHTRNSYFGQIDTAGFLKDSYYIYQSAWTAAEETSMVHVFPYWDFNPGQLIDVRVASNAPIVELFVNGVSQGEYYIDHENGTQLTGNWQIPYEEGELTAVAYDKQHRELARQTRHSFGNPVRLVMEEYPSAKELTAGAGDLTFITVSAVDAQGYPVENANNLIHVEVMGAGWLTGLDNGDSTDTEQYKGYEKRLFSGKLLIIAAVGEHKGEITVRAFSDGLESAVLVIPVTQEKKLTGGSFLPECFAAQRTPKAALWVRKIELASEEGKLFTSQKKQMRITASIMPKEAAEMLKPQDLIWKAVNDAGIESPLAKVEPEKDAFAAKVTALGDGEFRVRCMVKNGTDKVKVISQLEFRVEGQGRAYLNPYEFIAGGLYTYAEGEVGNGNEHGVSTARDGRTVVGFDKIDFGNIGSDRITLPIFELGGEPCPIQIWEGIPGQEGSELLADVVYHKPSIWNVYREEAYTLKRRVKGIAQLCFVLNQKIHLKGFSFTPVQKAYEKLYAAETDAIYGDDFTILEKEIHKIGNNVTLEYHDMDFGQEGCECITICGRTQNDKNTIHISIADAITGEEEIRQIVEFTGSDEEKEMTFSLDRIKGKKTVRFIFLPGSRFDFTCFQFQHK